MRPPMRRHSATRATQRMLCFALHLRCSLLRCGQFLFYRFEQTNCNQRRNSSSAVSFRCLWGHLPPSSRTTAAMRDEVPRTRPPLQELFVHVLFLAFEQDCMKTHCNSFLVEACSGE